MAMTPEKKVKTKITKILDAHNVYHFSPFMAGMGRAGIPDIIACCDGHFLAIEAKAGTNKPTELQLRELKKIDVAGGCAMVVNEHNLDELVSTINELRGSL